MFSAGKVYNTLQRLSDIQQRGIKKQHMSVLLTIYFEFQTTWLRLFLIYLTFKVRDGLSLPDFVIQAGLITIHAPEIAKPDISFVIFMNSEDHWFNGLPEQAVKSISFTFHNLSDCFSDFTLISFSVGTQIVNKNVNFVNNILT